MEETLIPQFLVDRISFSMWGLMVLWLLAVIFSLRMLLDCLRRDPGASWGLTKSGEYDKVLWALFILLTLWIPLGAFFYWYLVKKKRWVVLRRPRTFPPRGKDTQASGAPELDERTSLP